MPTSLTSVFLAALALPCVAGSSTSNLRKLTTDPVPVKGSIDDAKTAAGCPCLPDQKDCGCGHVPTMVEHGHFANNKYQTQLGEMHDGEKHYQPTLMPHGYFDKDNNEEPTEPKEMPEEKPNMVPPGHFAKVAAALRDEHLSKTFGTVATQKEGACDILERVTKLGRFVYEAETTVENGIAGSGTAINNLLDVVCPLIGARFPDAAKCMPSCDAMKERVTKLSDPKYIGEIKTKKQKCENTKGRVVNFALLAGLSSTDMLLGTDFCPPLRDTTELRCDDKTEEDAATGAAVDPAVANDQAMKAAEKATLQMEGLTWHQHMIKPIEAEDDGARLPVAPDMNATAVECDRDCKIQKQLRKEKMEAELGEAGVATYNDKPYDVHQDQEQGQVVTEEESKGGINAPRGGVDEK
jgi:hypothetical protein